MKTAIASYSISLCARRKMLGLTFAYKIILVHGHVKINAAAMSIRPTLFTLLTSNQCINIALRKEAIRKAGFQLQNSESMVCIAVER